MTKLNQRQELFCINYVSGMTATDAAIEAGYSPKYARENCPKLRHNTTIEARIMALNAKLIGKTVASVKERKERLTTILREDNLTDKGNLARGTNIQAISELNKMEKIYTEGTINVDARTLNIHVNSDKAKELTQKLIDGAGTE